jgi:hypothetical protein
MIVNLSELVWKLLKSPFESVPKMEIFFNTIEMLIRITRKNIAKAKKKLIINSTNELVKMEKAFIKWEHTIRYFSFDPIKKTIDFAAFSYLLDQIMSFSLLPVYNEDNEKYYFLFRVYLSHLWKSDLKGLFEAPVRNLSALICYLYDYWEVIFIDYKYTFLYFKGFQCDRKFQKDCALKRLERDILGVLDDYNKEGNHNIPSHLASLVAKVVEPADEMKKDFSAAYYQKLKAVVSFLETLIEYHPQNKPPSSLI